MYLEIISPDKKIFSGDVSLVQLPGSTGSFEVMENHAPIISSLTNGKVRVIIEDGKEQLFDIGGGVIESNNNKLIILVEEI